MFVGISLHEKYAKFIESIHSRAFKFYFLQESLHLEDIRISVMHLHKSMSLLKRDTKMEPMEASDLFCRYF